MMEHNTEKLLSAIGDVDAAYLEEALDFDAANAGRKRAARFPKLSAACVAVLVILGVSVTAFAVSRLPLSWRDIFSPEQTVIGDGDETGGLPTATHGSCGGAAHPCGKGDLGRAHPVSSLFCEGQRGGCAGSERPIRRL